MSKISSTVLSVCLLLTLCFTGVEANAGNSTVFSIRGPESTADKRYDYDQSVFELALTKTIPEFGPYKLITAPPMNFARAIKTAQSDTYQNFFLKLSYEHKHRDKGLDFASFPVDLGIVGYRVCFLSDQIKEKLEAASSFNEIKKFNHGQGLGWSDVGILRNQNLKVYEIAGYENLFKMVAKNRFDLFCRGTNELLDEYEANKEINHLTYDTSMAIAYPMPRFFYTSKTNQTAIKRIQAGLVEAYRDGSLFRLWLDFYGPSIEFVKLNDRKIYWITNPNLKGLDDSYKAYFYDPFK